MVAATAGRLSGAAEGTARTTRPRQRISDPPGPIGSVTSISIEVLTGSRRSARNSRPVRLMFSVLPACQSSPPNARVPADRSGVRAVLVCPWRQESSFHRNSGAAHRCTENRRPGLGVRQAPGTRTDRVSRACELRTVACSFADRQHGPHDATIIVIKTQQMPHLVSDGIVNIHAAVRP